MKPCSANKLARQAPILSLVKLPPLSNVNWLNVLAVVLVLLGPLLAIIAQQLHWSGLDHIPAYLIACGAVLAYMGKE